MAAITSSHRQPRASQGAMHAATPNDPSSHARAAEGLNSVLDGWNAIRSTELSRNCGARLVGCAVDSISASIAPPRGTLTSVEFSFIPVMLAFLIAVTSPGTALASYR